MNLSEDKFLDTIKEECETAETLGSLISHTEDEEERQPKGVGPQLLRPPAATRELTEQIDMDP